ncbi:MAG: hypothetical protein HY580_03810, partial [Nitrospinae bacterium]|nr:hypothetical protein [Nitrospinota bacterium]
TYSKKGYFSIAINHCKKVLALDGADYEAMNRLAWLYAKKKTNLDQGLSLSMKTVEAFPGRAEFIDTLSEIHFVRGETEKALESIKRAIDLSPEDNYYKQQLWRFKNAKP